MICWTGFARIVDVTGVKLLPAAGAVPLTIVQQSLVFVPMFVVFFQNVSGKVAIEVSKHRVGMVRLILRIVVLNQ